MIVDYANTMFTQSWTTRTRHPSSCRIHGYGFPIVNFTAENVDSLTDFKATIQR